MGATKPIITISREFGAGGRSIAKGLSEALGIPWYDRDFVRLTAKNSEYSEEEILQEGEEISEGAHFLDSILNNMAAYTSSHDAIFKAQKQVIMELAEEPCIIVGRCSNVVLREAKIPSFDIFLYADEAIRTERAKDLVDESVTDLKKYVHKRDELRETYYKTYTKREINQAQDYTLCIDTGVIDYAYCIELIAGIYRKLYGE